MDPAESLVANAWRESSSSGSGQHPFIEFATRLQNQFGAVIGSQFSKLSRSAEVLSSFGGEPSRTQIPGNGAREWDPDGMLNNLSFLEQKIHQLREMVHLIIACRNQCESKSDEILVQQQQLITADLTSIIVQLLSTAGSLLPSMRSSSPPTATPKVDQPCAVTPQVDQPCAVNVENTGDQSNEMDISVNDEDGDDGENLAPGSYEILQLEKEEILAPHTHFCTVCGKGFKRDANLRMHMRGHGEVYKTTAALAKPSRESSLEQGPIKRYSCPFLGCKRNKDHKRFQPLKTIQCVKNHYKRTHCDKSYICSRCHTKRFSVIADLKTHEKHCGRDRWICSCRTTFSRKDKLLSHISLFQQGHSPAIPLDDFPNAAVFQGHHIPVDDPPKGPSPAPPDAAFQPNASSSESFRLPFSPLSNDSSEFPAAFARPACDDTDSNFSFPINFS